MANLIFNKFMLQMFVYFSIHINDLKAIFVNVVVCKSNLKLMFKKQAIFYFDSEIFANNYYILRLQFKYKI